MAIKKRKTTTRKSTSSKTESAAKPTIKTAPVAGVTLSDDKPSDLTTTINRKVLFERLKTRLPDMKGSDVRQVMEAMLTELGDTLIAGENVKIPELGNMRVVKQKELENAKVVTVKLRRKKSSETANEPLEPSGE